MPERAAVDLSVIIPTLRRPATAALLAHRVKELLSGVNVEIIAVLPGGRELPLPTEHVRFITDSGRGVYGAYNAGLRIACGEYVWFLGDDDYPLDAADLVCTILKEQLTDLLIAPVLMSSGRLYRPTRSLLALHFLNWCQQGVIYRRRALVRRRLFRRLRVQADQYVNIRLRSDPSVKKTFLDQPICVFGINGVSGRLADPAYRALRPALAWRTLGHASYLAFRLLSLVEPAVKRLVKIR